MRILATLACSVAGSLLLGGASPPASVARLELAAHGHVVWQAPLDAGERFDVAFIHSQERTLWTQHYSAGPGHTLWQDGSTFGSYGAGMPPGATRRSSDGFTVRVNRRLSPIVMLNSRAARVRLTYRGRTLAIDQWFEDYEPFEIRVR